MKNIRQNLEEGFTLVELMVVVAIIGILSAVAIPNFKKYQAKSKTSEAKLHLSSIYSAETAFIADSDTYATCLTQMGYDPTAEISQRYYATGFTAESTYNAVAIANLGGIASACVNGNLFFAAGKRVGGAVATTNAWLPTGMIVNTAGDEFVAGAGGPISADFNTSGTGDQWRINHNKQLVHPRIGY